MLAHREESHKNAHLKIFEGTSTVFNWFVFRSLCSMQPHCMARTISTSSTHSMQKFDYVQLYILTFLPARLLAVYAPRLVASYIRTLLPYLLSLLLTLLIGMHACAHNSHVIEIVSCESGTRKLSIRVVGKTDTAHSIFVLGKITAFNKM